MHAGLSTDRPSSRLGPPTASDSASADYFACLQIIQVGPNTGLFLRVDNFTTNNGEKGAIGLCQKFQNFVQKKMYLTCMSVRLNRLLFS